MINRIISTIKAYSMLKGGEHITVALSGGADSVCLLSAMKEISTQYNLHVDAIHINHCIRGEEADRDELFCKKLCEKLEIPFTVKRIDVPSYAIQKKLSVEEAAREVRYEEFSKHCPNSLIATAHTASDNAETVLFNFTRGTGLKGICGIPPIRGNIIRPLIDVTRQDVEKYIEKYGLEYVTDSTNLTIDYTRNRIRHNIIPEILKINNGFYKTFCTEIKIFSEENSFIEKHVNQAYNECENRGALENLTKYDTVVRKRCIARLLKENALPISSEKINSIDEILDCGGKINITKNTFVVCRSDILSIVRMPDENTLRFSELSEGENSIFDGRIVHAEIKQDKDGIIDIDKVCGTVILRSRNYGDKIRLSGRNCTSSVKKLINENIRADLKPYLHFLADDEGLIYIEGIGVAERVKTDENTVKSLHINVIER